MCARRAEYVIDERFIEMTLVIVDIARIRRRRNCSMHDDLIRIRLVVELAEPLTVRIGDFELDS